MSISKMNNYEINDCENYQTKENYSKSDMKKILFGYASASLLCLIFSLIYGIFSHDVTSPYMTYLCLFPLILGVIPFSFLAFVKKIPLPQMTELNLYGSGVGAVTLSSGMKGIFEIAGTGSFLQTILMYIGSILILAGTAVYLIHSLIKKINKGA